MRLYSAIDILGGNAVRLVRGDFDAGKVYDRDPLSAARGWTEAGATDLHVVDLDGARSGAPVNLEHLRRICGLGVPVQYGGGLRSIEAIDGALAAGARRVILGTAAFTEPELLDAALEAHGSERVLVSVDVRGGKVMIKGWTEAAEVSVTEVFARLIKRGVRTMAYTNVDRDGMLDGLQIDGVTVVARAVQSASSEPPGSLIYSGGIGELSDLEQLAELRSRAHLNSLDGVIVGKALYEKRFTIEQAQAALGS